jgi:hypothetical protein
MFKKKSIIVNTRNINQAAFLTTIGGKLLEIRDSYPNNIFVVEAHPLSLWWEKHFGLIPYRKYCNQRIRLKERGRRMAKLPEHFVGKDEGFNFADIARVRPFTKKEQLTVTDPFPGAGDKR